MDHGVEASQESRILLDHEFQGGTEHKISEHFLSALLTKHRRKPRVAQRMHLMGTPVARFQWGEHQHEAHTVWGSLFFDLIYVGVAFQLGKLLTDGLKTGHFPEAFGTFVAIYLGFENIWFLKLTFDGRYDVDDLFHRILQIFQGAVVALGADSVAKLKYLQDLTAKRNAVTLSCCFLAFLLLDVLDSHS